MVTGAWWQAGGQRGRGNQCQAHGLTGSPGSCLDDVAVGTTRGTYVIYRDLLATIPELWLMRGVSESP